MKSEIKEIVSSTVQGWSIAQATITGPPDIGN